MKQTLPQLAVIALFTAFLICVSAPSSAATREYRSGVVTDVAQVERTDSNYNFWTGKTTDDSYRVYRISIEADAMSYVVDCDIPWECKPNEWTVNGSVQFRVNKNNDRMYLLRPNGKEVNTKITKQIKKSSPSAD